MAIQFSLILNLAISHKLLCVIFSSSVKSILKFPLWLFCLTFEFIGLPGWLRWLRVCLAMQEMQETQIWSWFGEIPWRRKWPPTPVYLPGKSYGQRSLVGCSPWPCTVGHDFATEHTWIFFFQVFCLNFQMWGFYIYLLLLTTDLECSRNILWVCSGIYSEWF